MDKYSEVEVKFAADHVTPEHMQGFVDEQPLEYNVDNYRYALGTDVFYRLGTGALRFRKDSVRVLRHMNADGTARLDQSHVTSCLTVKQRKSDDHIIDRREVDLWVGPQDEADVTAMVDLLGGNKLFSIKKEYHVWMLRKGGFHVCLALYDVSYPDGKDKRRFLEVEIEKDSKCSGFDGGIELRKWELAVKAAMAVGEPINQSLFEMYGSK